MKKRTELFWTSSYIPHKAPIQIKLEFKITKVLHIRWISYRKGIQLRKVLNRDKKEPMKQTVGGNDVRIVDGFSREMKIYSLDIKWKEKNMWVIVTKANWRNWEDLSSIALLPKKTIIWRYWNCSNSERRSKTFRSERKKKKKKTVEKREVTVQEDRHIWRGLDAYIYIRKSRQHEIIYILSYSASWFLTWLRSERTMERRNAGIRDIPL